VKPLGIAVSASDFNELEGDQTTPKKMGPGGGPTWSQLARRHWPDYVLIGAMFVALTISELIPPFKRQIFHGFPGENSDVEIWRYSFPLKVDTVPPQLVPPIAFLVPSAVMAAYHVIKTPPRADTHAAVLGLFAAVLVNALLTNFVKIMVGRPRPDFMARCWPDGAKVTWNADGTPACAATSVNPDEGRKSFPSGHTSWSTTGLGYLSLWIAGKLQAFDWRGGQPWRLITALVPLCTAIWVGLTRIEDYWHHWEDVLAGFLLGCLVAYTFYRQQYPPLAARTAGEAYAAQAALSGAANGGSGSGGSAYSSLELSNGPHADLPV